MFAAYGRNTAASAKPYVKPEAPERRCDFVEDKRRRDAERKEAEERLLAERRAQAQDDIRKGREAARRFRNNELRQFGLKRSEIELYEHVEAIVARATGISARELRSESRARRLIPARQCLMYWARRRLNISFPLLGRLMCRDHSTVLYGSRSYIAKRRAKGRRLYEVR